MKSPYGFCPICGSIGIGRERRPNGNDVCINGHVYMSSTSVPAKGNETLKTEPKRTPMTPDDYQRLAGRTECDQAKSLARMTDEFFDAEDFDRTFDPQHTMLSQIRLNHSVMGLAGEVGEIASLLQKWIYYGKQFKEASDDEGAVKDELKQKLIEEFGDVLWYVAEGLNTIQVSMEEVMRRNIEKLKIRYPEKYTDWHAADENRKLVEEESALRIHTPAPMDYELPE